MSLYFIGIILLALLFLEILPYNIVTRNAYLVGSMAELTVFSLALAHRVKLLQKQNTAYQQELLLTERSAKHLLESEVAERTAETQTGEQRTRTNSQTGWPDRIGEQTPFGRRALASMEKIKTRAEDFVGHYVRH